MTLITELIDIQPWFQKRDFVLRADEDISRPEVVFGNKVVTPEPGKRYDAALSFPEKRGSKPTYLNGSFSSCQGIFRAVLDLLFPIQTSRENYSLIATESMDVPLCIEQETIWKALMEAYA